MRISDWSSDVCSSDLLRHRLAGKAIGLLQRGSADDRARPAEEGRVPQVVALLHRAVEQVAFARQFLHIAQVALHRVGRIEMVRRLHQRQPRVLLAPAKSEEHTSELQSLMRISYAVFCLKKKNTN